MSNLWARTEMVDNSTPGQQSFSYQAVDRLGDWKKVKTASRKYWEGRQEREIVEGVKTFMVTTHDVTRAAWAASHKGDPTIRMPSYTLRRTDAPFPSHPTCYTAVMYWLFRSGLVSYRWMLRNNLGSLRKWGLEKAFGPPKRRLWKGSDAFGDTSSLPIVPKGHVVHLYVDNSSRWLGHWLISTGDGNAYGRNNDDEEGRANREYALCDLNAQYRGGYKETLTDVRGQSMVQQGVADEYDPLLIPDRL